MKSSRSAAKRPPAISSPPDHGHPPAIPGACTGNGHSGLTEARKRIPLAKNQHTFAKRQREIEKKRKAEEKRAKRLRKKEDPDAADDAADSDAAVDTAPPE